MYFSKQIIVHITYDSKLFKLNWKMYFLVFVLMTVEFSITWTKLDNVLQHFVLQR